MEFAQERIIRHSATNYSVSYGDDSGVAVEFYNHPVLQEFESEKQGRPIYKDVPYISIDFPGDKTKRVCRPVKMDATMVTPSDPQRFPRHWEAFKNQQEQVPIGTPVTEWAPLSKAQALELKGMKIYTVENLASLPDSSLTFLGARELREKAKNWLESAKTGSISTQVMAQLDKLKADNEIMRQQLADLNAREETNDSPRRGRPPKQPQE
jgi:hypothetical protein